MLKAKEAAATTAMDAKLMISGQIREQSMAQTVYYHSEIEMTSISNLSSGNCAILQL